MQLEPLHTYTVCVLEVLLTEKNLRAGPAASRVVLVERHDTELLVELAYIPALVATPSGAACWIMKWLARKPVITMPTIARRIFEVVDIGMMGSGLICHAPCPAPKG